MDVPVVAPSAGGVQQQGAQPAVPAVPPEPQPQVPAGQSPQSSDDGKGSLSPVVAKLVFARCNSSADGRERYVSG